ncbi:WecB/TagA/CpsF family glycosyltransferase [bacterium]|nr:WecB/TagA/CpsF family glycosyltransferase [bacterium]
MERKQFKLLGFDIDLFNSKEAIDYVNNLIDGVNSSHIVTLNPEMIEYASKHADFAKIIKEAELVLPDGVGVTLGLKINGINAERITGIGFAQMLIEIASKNCIPLALVGAQQEVVQKASENLKKKFPDLNIVYSHDGYFSDNNMIFEELKQVCPKILLVALGSPKQEEFIYELKSILPSTLMIGIGGSFDVWAGKVQRAPQIWQNFGLEWLYRTIKQPQRFKRIFPTLPVFMCKIIIERFSKKG